MQIPREGIEWGLLTMKVPVPPGSDVSASIDQTTWVPCFYDDARPGNWKVLIAGPDAADPGQPVLKVTVPSHVRVRIGSDPESVIRSAGRVTVGG